MTLFVFRSAGGLRPAAASVLLALAQVVYGTGSGESPALADEAPLRAGAAAVDITPEKLPVIVSGGFLESSSNTVHSRLYARSLVLQSGQKRVALLVVDTLMMPRELLDRAKQLAQQSTGIPAEHMMISATHTHSAPSVMGALGSGVQEDYAAALPGKLAEAVRLAAERLEPAQLGWAVIDAAELTNCRRWIRRPDRIGVDPFGQKTIRAMMHPGYQNPDYICPAGPVDSALTLLAVQTTAGQPLAVLCNYPMHYFGAPAVSADYFGLFCDELAAAIAAEHGSTAPQPAVQQPPGSAGQPGAVASAKPVVMMSQGTSGDLHWMDYSRPRKSIGIGQYADALAAKALAAYKTVEYHQAVPLAVAQRKLALRRRTPDQQRLAWAKRIIATMVEPPLPQAGAEQDSSAAEAQLDLSQFPKGLRKPRNQQEVYALEQIYLHLQPQRQVELQAIRIGQLGITAIPCEVFGITGLKLKAQSPLVPLMNIELANGAEGYIPPPEQHRLGGYTTWPARTAALEVDAEPKIVESLLGMLEELAGSPRRKPADAANPYIRAVLNSKPALYWQLGDWSGPQASDSSGNACHGTYEGPYALALPGIDLPGFRAVGGTSRAVYFAGGCAKVCLPALEKAWSAELWFWSGLPIDAESFTACLVELQPNVALRAADVGGQNAPLVSYRLCLVQTKGKDGRLAVIAGEPSAAPLLGRQPIAPRTWNHVVLVCQEQRATVYLNGAATAEIAGELSAALPAGQTILTLANTSDGQQPLEGKIDELALYRRPLGVEEIAQHYKAAIGDGNKP